MNKIDKAFEIIIKDLEENSINFAQKVLNSGLEATYMNDDGIIVKEFPNGAIYQIDYDFKQNKTIYLKRLK